MGDTPDAYGVVGHPVSHSWSPFIHGLFARQTGQNIVYRLYDVPPEDFRRHAGRFFEAKGKGLNVTVPHKHAAAEFANELTARAALAGAANTLVAREDHHLLGDNTDGVGLVRDLKANLGLSLAGSRVLLLGAGGAARGVLGPLLELGLAELVLANRTAGRALDVAAEFAVHGPVRGCGFAEVEAAPFDLIVNATAASLRGEVPDVPRRIVGPATVCYDMAYGRHDTAFVSWARAAGCARAVQGWGMLVEQAAESFFLWRGVRPDTPPVLAALEAHPAAPTG